MSCTTRQQVRQVFRQGISKLEIGSGRNPETGYVHLDIQPDLPGLDIVGDARKMPIPNNFVSGEIRAVHILEHFCHPDFAGKKLRQRYGTTLEIVKECYRVLKPGGKLKIVTPDYQKICQSVTQKRIPLDWLQLWTVGGHHDEYDVHHWLWTKADAINWFSQAGFSNLRDWNPIQGWKKVWLLQWQTQDYQSRNWYDIEWYHWLFFEGTK